MKILQIPVPTFICVTHPITYSMITTCPSHRAKQLVCEAARSLPSSAKVKNEWSCTSALPCIFMVRRGTALPLPVTVASKLNYAIRPIEACIFHIRANFHFPLTIYVVLPMHLIRISPPPLPPCGDHFLNNLSIICSACSSHLIALFSTILVSDKATPFLPILFQVSFGFLLFSLSVSGHISSPYNIMHCTMM